MRASWLGSVTVNVFAVPVQLYRATEAHAGPKMHQVHGKDGGRIKYKRFCDLDDAEVEFSELVKAVEVDEDEQVILTDDDMKQLPVPSLHRIAIKGMVDAGEVDPIRFDQAYYIGLGKNAPDEPYVLLREALREGGKVAIAKVTLASKESLGLLRVSGDLLVLHTMYWPDEVRRADIRTPTATVHPNQLRMAMSLLEEVTKGFSWDDLHDEYGEAVTQLIDAKRHGGKLTPVPQRDYSNLIDINEILDRALESERALHGTSQAAPAAGRSARKTSAAKATAAKRAAPAKKAAAKKAAPARKTAAKRTGTRKAG